jgi:hypothetical protein
VLRTGGIFDSPPLGRALQSALSALGLLLDLKRLGKRPALRGAAGLTEAGLINAAEKTDLRVKTASTKVPVV